MNIWALKKDKQIKLLLFALQKALGLDSFQIEDEVGNSMDLYSIAFVKPEDKDIKAFIYTYGQKNDFYGIHLEYPGLAENEYLDSTQIYEDLTKQQIINTLATHFEITDLDMAM